jgi:TnpA family transposase
LEQRDGLDACAALQDYGRLVKTEYILRQLTRPDERRAVHRQLNKQESVHALHDADFDGNEARIRAQSLGHQSTQAAALAGVAPSDARKTTLSVCRRKRQAAQK